MRDVVSDFHFQFYLMGSGVKVPRDEKKVGFDLFIGFVDNKKNAELHQPHPLGN